MPARRYTISETDVPLFYEAMVAVAQTYDYPWSEHGIRRDFLAPTLSDQRDLPSAYSLSHQLRTFFNEEAQKVIKNRVRKARHRLKKRMICVHLEEDSWQAIKAVADDLQVSMSEAVMHLNSAYLNKDASKASAGT